MGVKELFKNLYGGAMDDQKHHFKNLSLLKDGANMASLDAGTLIFQCALTHKVAYLAGDYIPAVEEFKKHLTILTKVYHWDVTIILDGRSPEEKQHCHRRRRENNEDAIIIDGTYIGLCAKVCKRRFIKYIVAPWEADSQVCRHDSDSDKSCIAVCRDSDEIVYDNKIVVIVDSYTRQTFRIINMMVPLTDEMKEAYPLHNYYHKYGIRILRWWAAVMGCDISVLDCGIKGIGKDTFMKALKSFETKDPSSLDAHSFANVLRRNATQSVRLSYSVTAIRDELNRVEKWFSKDGTYYDKEGNVMSIGGGVVEAASKITRQHLEGTLDPKTRKVYSIEQKKIIAAAKVHNMGHNSSVEIGKINGLSLPDGKTSLDQCNVGELKAMVVARGGSVTNDNGKGMVKKKLNATAAAYLALEKQLPNSTVYYNRSRSNGIFTKIDTNEKKTIPDILKCLIDSGEHEQSLQKFFGDVLSFHSAGKFEDNFGTIVMNAPEMGEEFIHQCFINIGESTNQKNIVSGLTKVMEMSEVIYHAIAWADDGKSLYILSKQRASQRHDEKTRHTTAVGEKPKLVEYLVMAQLGVRPTTHASHGHTLGVFTHLMRHYCAACKAGCGLCNHKSGLMWLQQLHWGEGRPTPKPATSDYCSWFRGMRGARLCSTVEPASRTHREKLPTSEEAAKKKKERGTKKSMHEGIPATYDVFGDETKRAKIKSKHYRSEERWRKVFECLNNT